MQTLFKEEEVSNMTWGVVLVGSSRFEYQVGRKPRELKALPDIMLLQVVTTGT